MRKSVSWRRDPSIQARMQEVQRRHLAGQPNTQIARALDVDEITIRRDVERLSELWLEHIRLDAEQLRSSIVAELEDTRRRAVDAAEFDEAAERAVLTGEIDQEVFPDVDVIRRDDKGSVQFRGNKAAALKVAGDATMSKAKVLGLVIDKQEHSGEGLVRIYERGSQPAPAEGDGT